MENLTIILNILKKNESSFSGSFFIPEAWNFIKYDKYKTDETRKGEISINPYSFIAFCIESYLQKTAGDNCLCPRVNYHDDSSGVDLNRSTIYSMFPRMFTAWENYKKGQVSSGTFLKALCLLPYLRKMGVNIIYLLPIFEYSNRYKKGEVGSPYAIKNIYKLDLNLHDGLLGEYSQTLLDIEFKAFIEACHILGIRVMVDFVFRTVSRDNDLMLEHPEWFFWIDLKYNNSFSAPSMDTDRKLIHLNDRTLARLYRSKNMKGYLAQFTPPPNEIDSDKWQKLKELYYRDGKNILELTEKMYGITTVPGFSNMLNDPQPPWTDITFLKYYFDVHEKAKKYIPENQSPYILQDGVSLSLYHGEKANEGLWEYISGAIPYYQEKYGIDGARIDMGHALPTDLNKKIVDEAKKINKNFILWSEEFNPDKSDCAKADGFHFISGFLWSIYKGLDKPGFNKMLFDDTLMRSVLPVAAAIETPDTPRAALVHRDKRRIELLVMLNCFIPNAVLFINNGFEVMEVQPMNLGLDNTEEGRFVLEESDPMYGKLAFFDNYCIHWLNYDREWMQDLLFTALDLRKHFADIISKKDHYIKSSNKNRKITCICYLDNISDKSVVFIANRSFSSAARIDFNTLLPERVIQNRTIYKIAYNFTGLCDNDWDISKKMVLKPGEVIIGCLK